MAKLESPGPTRENTAALSLYISSWAACSPLTLKKVFTLEHGNPKTSPPGIADIAAGFYASVLSLYLLNDWLLTHV